MDLNEVWVSVGGAAGLRMPALPHATPNATESASAGEEAPSPLTPSHACGSGTAPPGTANLTRAATVGASAGALPAAADEGASARDRLWQQCGSMAHLMGLCERILGSPVHQLFIRAAGLPNAPVYVALLADEVLQSPLGAQQQHSQYPARSKPIALLPAPLAEGTDAGTPPADAAIQTLSKVAEQVRDQLPPVRTSRLDWAKYLEFAEVPAGMPPYAPTLELQWSKHQRCTSLQATGKRRQAMEGAVSDDPPERARRRPKQRGSGVQEQMPAAVQPTSVAANNMESAVHAVAQGSGGAGQPELAAVPALTSPQHAAAAAAPPPPPPQSPQPPLVQPGPSMPELAVPESTSASGPDRWRPTVADMLQAWEADRQRARNEVEELRRQLHEQEKRARWAQQAVRAEAEARRAEAEARRAEAEALQAALRQRDKELTELQERERQAQEQKKRAQQELQAARAEALRGTLRQLDKELAESQEREQQAQEQEERAQQELQADRDEGDALRATLRQRDKELTDSQEREVQAHKELAVLRAQLQKQKQDKARARAEVREMLRQQELEEQALAEGGGGPAAAGPAGP